jgi:hypothetical protein
MFILSFQESETPFPFSQKDGLVDIFIGLGIFFAGLFFWTEMVWMIAIFIPSFLPLLQSIRKRVLEPRIGEFAPNSNHDVRNQRMTLYVLLMIGILVLASFFVFFVFEFRTLPGIAVLRQFILLLLGIVFASLWIFAGVMLRIRRYFFYAALALVVLSAGQFANIPFWITCVILGGIIIFSGLLVLLRFLKQHPIK